MLCCQTVSCPEDICWAPGCPNLNVHVVRAWGGRCVSCTKRMCRFRDGRKRLEYARISPTRTKQMASSLPLATHGTLRVCCWIYIHTQNHTHIIQRRIIDASGAAKLRTYKWKPWYRITVDLLCEWPCPVLTGLVASRKCPSLFLYALDNESRLLGHPAEVERKLAFRKLCGLDVDPEAYMEDEDQDYITLGYEDAMELERVHEMAEIMEERETERAAWDGKQGPQDEHGMYSCCSLCGLHGVFALQENCSECLAGRPLFNRPDSGKLRPAPSCRRHFRRHARSQ